MSQVNNIHKCIFTLQYTHKVRCIDHNNFAKSRNLLYTPADSPHLVRSSSHTLTHSLILTPAHSGPLTPVDCGK